MEEVIGSIPIRSTNLAPPFGVNWCQFWVDTRTPFPLSSAHLSPHHACLRRRSARLPKLIVDRTSHLCYGLGDDFLVHVRRCFNTGMSHQTLSGLRWTFFLAQRCDGAPNDLEGQVRQVKDCRKLLKNPPAEIRGVDETSVSIRKMNASGDESGHLAFQASKSDTNSSASGTGSRLFLVLPQGLIFPL